MRSRYSAYVLKSVDYLLSSWHPHTRPTELVLDGSQQWLGLKVLQVVGGMADDETGQVEFVARYKVAGRGHRLQELSRFARVSNRWVYVDGDLKTV